MGLIATRDKRDKLRLLYEDAVTASIPLQRQLMLALRACDQVAPNGKWIQSTGEGGGSVGFAVLQGMSPRDARRLVGELLDLYDQVVAYLAPPIPEDADVYTQMLGVGVTTGPRLARVGAVQQDYTGLRYGTGLNVASQ